MYSGMSQQGHKASATRVYRLSKSNAEAEAGTLRPRRAGRTPRHGCRIKLRDWEETCKRSRPSSGDTMSALWSEVDESASHRADAQQVR